LLLLIVQETTGGGIPKMPARVSPDFADLIRSLR
jgi:hypothetical protein